MLKRLIKSKNPFMIKAVEGSRIQGVYLNRIKVLYNKPIININLNQKTLKTILLKSRIRQGCPLTPYLFTIIL